MEFDNKLLISHMLLYEALRGMVDAYWRGSEDSDDEHAPHAVRAALAALAMAALPQAPAQPRG